MSGLIRVICVCFFLLSVSACTIRHEVAADYPQYLANNEDDARLPETDKASGYYLEPATQSYTYEFRAVVTGYANLWVVDFGQMLDDTLGSKDVQSAFGGLKKTPESALAAGDVLVFKLNKYVFEEHAANVSLNVSLYRAGEFVFSKTYNQTGKSQGGKMFWGGVFAQKNAVQQSTKLAIDEILRQLILDLNKQ